MKKVINRTIGTSLATLALLAGVCAVSALPAAANDQVRKLSHRQQSLMDRNDRLQNQVKRADRAQTGLLSKITALDANRARAESKVRSLSSNIAALDSGIAATKDRLAASSRRLAVLSDQLAAILRKLEARTQAFTTRAVATYEAGPTGGLDALLSSQNFGDLMTRYTYYRSAMSVDTKLMEQIQGLQSATESHRSAVESRRAAVVAAREKLQQDRAALAGQRRRKKAALGSLKTLIAKKHRAVDRIKTKKSALKEAIAENARESNQIQALLFAAGGGFARADRGGQLLWPADGPITSPFGWRVHPIFGTRELHPGVDIGAPYGSTVIAADAGVVEFAGVMTGYGNVLVIDHGGGLATLYGHLSAYTVAVGQNVGRGAPIANVGCTGYCTGPHLHFEVRINGVPVNPVPYLQ